MTQRTVTCNECSETFRDKRTAEQSLIDAIYGDLCPTCRRKKDFVTCTACNEPIEKGREIYYEGLPYHHYDLPVTQTP